MKNKFISLIFGITLIAPLISSLRLAQGVDARFYSSVDDLNYDLIVPEGTSKTERKYDYKLEFESNGNSESSGLNKYDYTGASHVKSALNAEWTYCDVLGREALVAHTEDYDSVYEALENWDEYEYLIFDEDYEGTFPITNYGEEEYVGIAYYSTDCVYDLNGHTITPLKPSEEELLDDINPEEYCFYINAFIVDTASSKGTILDDQCCKLWGLCLDEYVYPELRGEWMCLDAVTPYYEDNERTVVQYKFFRAWYEIRMVNNKFQFRIDPSSPDCQTLINFLIEDTHFEEWGIEYPVYTDVQLNTRVWITEDNYEDIYNSFKWDPSEAIIDSMECIMFGFHFDDLFPYYLWGKGTKEEPDINPNRTFTLNLKDISCLTPSQAIEDVPDPMTYEFWMANMVEEGGEFDPYCSYLDDPGSACPEFISIRVVPEFDMYINWTPNTVDNSFISFDGGLSWSWVDFHGMGLS